MSLIELLISMGMFTMLLGTVFLLFGVGSRTFLSLETRQTAQNQLAAIRASYQRDLQVTHFYGIHLDTANSVTLQGVVYPRHALSAVSLSDPARTDAYDMYGVPQWDQWVVYRVVGQEMGQLLRHTVAPAAGQRGRQLLRSADGLANLALAVTPYNSAWGRVSPPQILARDVRSLKAKLDPQQRAVEVQVTIEKKVDYKNPKPDVLTATFYVKPHNTVPTD